MRLWRNVHRTTSASCLNIGLRACMSHQVLRNACMSHQVLRNASMSHQVLRNASMSHQVLRNASMSHQVLRNASMSHQVLRNASMSHQVLRNASMSHQVLQNASEHRKSSVPLPAKAKVVICGGGAQGAAIAYKLAEHGWGPDVVLLEKGKLGGGTAWNSSGVMGMLKNSSIETRLALMSKALYKDLEDQGWYTGIKPVGSLYVATKKDRMLSYQRMLASSVTMGLKCKMVTPDEIKEISSLVNTDDLIGGMFVVDDGVANPFEICMALGKVATDKGVHLVENCTAKEVASKDGKVSQVETDQGTIECEYFVNCAGFWARKVGELARPPVSVPIHPAEHYYLHTKPVNKLPSDFPVVRDPDGHCYIRENQGRFLAGGFEPKAKPAFADGVLPDERLEMSEDWDHFNVLLENLLHRIPCLNDAMLQKLVNGPEAWSPDGQWILGQAPEMENYYVAAAMRSIGIASAGGVGTVIAEWIVKGRQPFDMYGLDIARFLGMHNNRRFLRDRVMEVPSLNSTIPYPHHEFSSGRFLRTSPIYPKMVLAGAQFGQVMGYERPMFFKLKKPQSLEMEDEEIESQEVVDSGKGDMMKLPLAKTEVFYRPPWFQAAAEEFKASREGVTVTDYSSFSKMDLWSAGREVVDFLQMLCSNDVDIKVGEIIHTGMQNQWGGYENDCSLARLADNRYMLMSPSIQQTRSYTWLRRHLPADESVVLQDVTSLYTALCVMGPYSRALTSRLTTEDLDSFPLYSCRYMDIACAPDILTLNETHTGELGYIFYIPNEFALHVYDAICEKGKEFGLRQCGYYAMRAIRIEKFYAFWGQDLDSHSTPIECGRGFRCKMKKDIPFIGREALQKQMDEGVRKQFVMLLLDPVEHNSDLDPWPWGGEPIYRDGVFCGNVTTTSYGFSLDKQICLGFVHDIDAETGERKIVTPTFLKNGNFKVNIAGTHYSATCRINPPNMRKYEAP